LNLSAWILNTAWMASCRSEWKRFCHATSRVKEAQAAVLRDILIRNRDCEFGKRCRFGAIRSPREYVDRVPMGTVESLAESVGRIATGANHVLTTEPVLCLQPTSGSTQGEKLIPATRSLRGEYQRMVAAWIGNLFMDRPAVRSGRAYWSTSPALGPPRRTASGLPIGFEDDTAYLGFVERFFARGVIVAPPAMVRELDVQSFRYATLLHMVLARDLSLISVWSPTFLSALLDLITTQAPSLIRDIHDGTTAGVPGAARRRPDRSRAREIESVMQRGVPAADVCRSLWPELALVSCWMDGPSRLLADRLRSQCVGIEFQPKGLLATEGCVTFPVVGQAGAAFAIRSHFFEFLPTGKAGDTLLTHELEVGGRYEVVVTTGGGLYRYPLGDTIEIVGFLKECPLARFVGRGALTSDLVGEKLHESFVQDCIERALRACGVTATYVALAPVVPAHADGPSAESCHYELLVETAADSGCAALATTLDRNLRANVHYGYARDLGQLGRIELIRLPGPPGSAWAAYEKSHGAGKVLGGLKPRALVAMASDQPTTSA
jgi:hypothetical protein